MPAGTGHSLTGSTQVLIAGGGPVGLAAAMELGLRGIDCVVVEPRVTVSHARPRCKTVNVRTMEHLRRWGLADRLRELAPLAVDWSSDVVFCTSLSGRELSRFHGVLGLAREGDRFPEPGQQAPQYVLEELLRESVTALPSCRLVTGARVTGVQQNADKAQVTVEGATGESSVVIADYVLGSDGPGSAVRAAIGAAYEGEHALRPNFGMVFRAPGLWADVQHGRAVHYWIINAKAPALMGPIDTDGTWWLIAFGVDRATGIARGRELIDAAAGTAVDAEILSTDPWTARMQLVDHAHVGRVLLAGDAAHLNPPFGGHGLNTGIGDAVDLGWKLSAMLTGWGGDGLLDSYEIERKPLQRRVIDAAAANMAVLSTELLADNLDDDDAAGEQARRAAHLQIQETKDAEFHALDLVLDVAYDGSPIVASDDRAGEAIVGARVVGAAVVGGRLPHVWLAKGRSLYDELGDGMTLVQLAGDDLSPDLAQAALDRHLPLRHLDLRQHRLRDRYGADLVLVRPDQHIAWRSDTVPADAGALLDRIRGA